MKTLADKIDFWIFREYEVPARGLPLFRIFFACLLLALYLPKNSLVWSLPASFYAPPLSLALLFPAFPPHWFFQVTDYLLVLGTVCLLFGCHTRFFSFFLAFLLVLMNSIQYSTGKIDHEILIPATLFCMGFSDWGNRYSADERRLPRTKGRPLAWPLTLLMLMVALAMSTAAVSKAKSGWLDPAMECCRGQLLLNYAGMGRTKWLADVMLGIHSRLFWKALDVSTVMLEAAFLFAMFRLAAMRFVAASACIFHGMIYFSMDILFVGNPGAYASLCDFRFLLRWRLVRRAVVRFAQVARRMKLMPLVIIVTGLYALYLPIQPMMTLPGFVPLPLALVAGTLVGVGICGALFAVRQAFDEAGQKILRR